MRGIRRFQRIMIVTLVGLNILVFSTSFYGDLSSALDHALLGMSVTFFMLLAYSVYRRYRYSNKSEQGTPQSQ
ncbi:hypothetical protein N9F27_00630 [Crocinitomicaceae bacterium]|nr:hypothetical protein [Crocinitomicaceae bacterium]